VSSLDSGTHQYLRPRPCYTANDDIVSPNSLCCYHSKYDSFTTRTSDQRICIFWNWPFHSDFCYPSIMAYLRL